MKKRKELNALIGLSGDSKRKKTKKGSGHRLLRTEPPDSESETSSDDDDFNNLSGLSAFGKSYAQCCNVCYPLCVFIILAACVIACAGLIWMQIALKDDLDNLKEKIHTMDSSQKMSSHEIPKLSEDLKSKQKKLEDLQSGDKGLDKLWSNLTEIYKKISMLDSAVNHLKANIKSAADLISLPTTVEELQKSVATIGSTLTSVQHDVKTIQTIVEDQRKEVDNQKKLMNGSDGKSSAKQDSLSEKGVNSSLCGALKQEMVYLQQCFGELNVTQTLHQSWAANRIHGLQSTFSNLTGRVSSLESQSPFMQVKADESLVTTDQGGTIEDDQMTTAGGGSIRDLEPPTSGTSGPSQSNSKPKPTRRPRFLRQKRSERGEKSTLPGIFSVEGLETFFQHVGLNHDSPGVSYRDLQEFFGADTPATHLLKPYDLNGDHRYSLAELRAAAAL
ncbi:EF-hand calcium-binding domain-containing protein 14 isoform X2 [Clupea harengus]|uniref:EF-hand calcium-binding domain-containing protein 14 isoform X2 n=1 Tax=Clupea harengus TaxID=7950 RepID=A0A8M1KEI9_CLUHA|nr:EF-hand calcium-binding domain-containing protein 14 isoform X2 [Clupea harengus]